MAQVTNKGSKIAWRLNPAIGTTREIEETCSLIHRHAVTYSRIQEVWCNDELTDTQSGRLEHREKLLERRITDLVESLPHADANEHGQGGAWRVRFSGDPRGNTVRIIPPDGWSYLHDNWDGESIGCDN